MTHPESSGQHDVAPCAAERDEESGTRAEQSASRKEGQRHEQDQQRHRDYHSHHHQEEQQRQQPIPRRRRELRLDIPNSNSAARSITPLSGVIPINPWGVSRREHQNEEGRGRDGCDHSPESGNEVTDDKGSVRSVGDARDQQNVLFRADFPSSSDPWSAESPSFPGNRGPLFAPWPSVPLEAEVRRMPASTPASPTAPTSTTGHRGSSGDDSSAHASDPAQQGEANEWILVAEAFEMRRTGTKNMRIARIGKCDCTLNLADTTLTLLLIVFF